MGVGYQIRYQVRPGVHPLKGAGPRPEASPARIPRSFRVLPYLESVLDGWVGL